MRHCRKYGWLLRTRVVGLYRSEQSLTRAAERFSERNNIVHAIDDLGKKLWANAIPENGLDGGPRPHRKMSRRSRKLASMRKLGSHLSEETREKIRETTLGRKLPPYHRMAMSIAQNRPSVRRKKRQALLGRKLTSEHVANISNGLKGRPRPEWVKAKLRGRKRSMATRRRMSVAQKGRVVSEETKQKIRIARARQTFSEETRAKLSGSVVVVDRKGRTLKVTKEVYYAQNDHPRKKYVTHRSKEGQRRLDMRR